MDRRTAAVASVQRRRRRTERSERARAPPNAKAFKEASGLAARSPVETRASSRAPLRVCSLGKGHGKMRHSAIARFGAFVAGGMLLVHCSGLSQGGLMPRAGTAVRPVQPASAGGARNGRRVSWMTKGMNDIDLLYVSNANGFVNVYRFWQHTLVGVLTNFTQPTGECADAAGNVYIVDHSTSKIYEYAHGGTKAIKTLDDSASSPDGCSVDHNTGNLAVANDPY